jgi:iron-sulfur cluster repair protein YtfE (RIC family)
VLVAMLAAGSANPLSVPPPQDSHVQIPASIRAEHEAIHAALVSTTKAPGEVGAAAEKLAAVLHPHFQREEQIALPPLGLLAPLASGQKPSAATASSMLKMTDTLRAEMPRMLEEHTAIRAAVDGLRAAALAAKHAAAGRLADDLALHAQTEEEVLYPAAMLVGDLIRSRR